MLTLIDVTKMRPNMTSATSCVRAFTAPPFARRGRVTPERVQARRHWYMIRDNLKFLITKEKEEVNEVYNFGVIYNELINCRYIRHTVKQEQELKKNSHNDICLCNACALKITKEITKKHKNLNRTKRLLKGERQSDFTVIQDDNMTNYMQSAGAKGGYIFNLKEKRVT